MREGHDSSGSLVLTEALSDSLMVGRCFVWRRLLQCKSVKYGWNAPCGLSSSTYIIVNQRCCFRVLMLGSGREEEAEEKEEEEEEADQKHSA